MTTDLSDDYEDSDDEIDDQTHTRLLANVLNLSSRQHVQKPTRTEPTTTISEFNLVKSITGSKGTVHLQELTKSLRSRAKHVVISNKIKNTELKSKTLRKPLEKPAADRIRRTIAYTKTKNLLDRWEPVVTANRAAASLSFPLNSDNNLDINADINSEWRLKTTLEREIEKIDPITETFDINTDEQFPLTMEEMIEKRKEFALLRRYQSYKEAKARKQSKIKSKKYRRIMRREKVKQQMKEFELLQKTNPEEALKKLEEIEKARAEERISLRHKSTGKWAKSQQVRAKYDKESRKVLAEQLSISKDLTQKLQVHHSSDSEDEAEPSVNIPTQPNPNPWVDGIQRSEEINEFLSGYRKFWAEENNKNNANETVSEEPVDGKDPVNVKERADEKLVVLENNKKEKIQVKQDFNQRKRKKFKESSPFGDWNVSVMDCDGERFVDDVFDKLEYKLKQQSQKRYKRLLKDNLPTITVNEDSEETERKVYKADLSMPSQVKKIIINEQLVETPDSNTISEANEDFNVLKSIIQSKETVTEVVKDSNKPIVSEPVNLNTELPDILTTLDENDEEIDQRGLIAEAFEDDDIMEEFAKDKESELTKDTPTDINLNLPGWGVWGGRNILPSKQRTKRFIIKFPKEMPRKDKNKGNVIINENADKKMRGHLISELPFPFKSVKEFEASIRAPIGNTFVTETAFRRLTQPAVTTKLGTIIEPMSEEILMKKKRRNKKNRV